MLLDRQLHAEAYGRSGAATSAVDGARPGTTVRPGRRRAPASRPRAQLGALGRCIQGGGAQRRSPDGQAGRLCHCLEGDASAGPIPIGPSGCRRCFFRWDRVQLPAEADQRAPATRQTSRTRSSSPRRRRSAQAVARCPIACSTSARRSAWPRLNARCPSLSRSSVERFPERPPPSMGCGLGICLPTPVTTPATGERR